MLPERRGVISRLLEHRGAASCIHVDAALGEAQDSL